MKITTLQRIVPVGNLEGITSFQIIDPVEGQGDFPGAITSSVKGEPYGGQVTLQKIARKVAASGSVYPDKGTGVLAASCITNGTTVPLPSTVLQSLTTSLEAPGLLFLVSGGTASGEVRKITSISGSIATINRKWESGRVPLVNDSFELLVDTRYLEKLLVKAEYADSTNYATIRMMLWSWPIDHSTPTNYQTPRVAFDTSQPISNSGITYGVSESGYYHGEGANVDSRGFMGAQIRIDALSGGTVSLWVGAK